MRRSNFKDYLLDNAIVRVLTIIVTTSLNAVAAQQAPNVRPNIILMMADDMGFSDIGCYGSEIATPNLDRLARDGLRFTQFYNNARCCPTRASLLTGLYSHQVGVGFMVGDKGTPAYQGYLNDRCVTIAEALGAGVYHTLMTGKWHVGETRPHWPLDRGFEHYFGLINGASGYFALDRGGQMAVDNEPYQPQGDHYYMTDAFTDHAVQFIEDYGRKREPFFLYVAFTSPHWPVHAQPDDIVKYRGKHMDGWDALRTQRRQRMIDMGIVESRWPLTPRDARAPEWTTLNEKEKTYQDLKMAAYAAQIDRMDQGIGRITAKLKEVGADQNTLILFLADNGGCAEAVDRGKPGAPPGSKESYMSYGLPWANASNTPFRLYKHWDHEGGISTPLIAWWPAGIKQNKISHHVGHIIDILPTCLDAAGVPYPQSYHGRSILPVEGLSLLPVLRGQTSAGHDAIFWEHEGNRAVRAGKWKLVSRRPGAWELYDMEADRTELHNLADQQTEKVKELSEMYAQWAARCGVVDWQELNRREVKQPDPGRRAKKRGTGDQNK